MTCNIHNTDFVLDFATHLFDYSQSGIITSETARDIISATVADLIPTAALRNLDDSKRRKTTGVCQPLSQANPAAIVRFLSQCVVLDVPISQIINKLEEEAESGKDPIRLFPQFFLPLVKALNKQRELPSGCPHPYTADFTHALLACYIRRCVGPMPPPSKTGPSAHVVVGVRTVSNWTLSFETHQSEAVSFQ